MTHAPQTEQAQKYRHARHRHATAKPWPGKEVNTVREEQEEQEHEPHRYRHVVGPYRFKSIERDTAIVPTHFIVARIMHSGETTLFATGRYLDDIDISGPDYKFRERIVVIDSDQIDTLLAIPI